MRSQKFSFNKQMEALRADYDISTESRFRRDRPGVSSTGTNADYHIRDEAKFFKGIELARDIDRNDMVVGQGLNRLCDNIMQDTGLLLEPMTENETADEILYRRWTAWTEDPLACSTKRNLTFFQVAWMTLRAALVDGDILHLPLKNGQLQAVEAHRVRTPRGSTKLPIVHGVLLDELTGAARQYWVAKPDYDIRRPKSVSEVDKYDAFVTDANGRVWPSVLHIFDPKRFSQSRGVSAFNPIVDPASMHGDLQFATLVKAQVAASYTIFEEVAMGADQFLSAADQTGERTETSRDDGSTEIVEELSPGMRIKGKPGHKLTGFAPNVPNTEFFQHSLLILTIIAVNLGLPVAVLLLDPSQTNFSGWRGAMDQARIGFRRIQRWLRDQFYRPIYHWKIRQWLAEESPDGEALRSLEGSVDLFAHIWKHPRWPYIEPHKDAQTHQVRFGNTLTSPRRLYGENGEDWQEIFDETIEDRAYAIRKAKAEAQAINREFPDDELPVTWAHLCPLPVADSVTASADAQPEPAPAAPGGKPSGAKA